MGFILGVLFTLSLPFIFTYVSDLYEEKQRRENDEKRELEIIDGVAKVPTGAIRILELQEQGYAYLRP